jgi:outer membrane protein assembly factor BamB
VLLTVVPCFGGTPILRPSLAALLLTLAPLAARAQDFNRDRFDNWHHWRGPEATGASRTANPPLTWSPTTNIKWKADVPGRGSATPIVWGDQVFVITAVPIDRPVTAADRPKVDSKLPQKTEVPNRFYRFLVMSFDRATGKPRWQRTAAEKVPHEGHHQTNTYASGSPTTDGKSLYVSFGSFGIYCYDLDGTPRWQKDLGRLSTRFGFGETVTPVIHEGRLVLNWDQEENAELIVLDAKTGEIIWKKARDERSTWTTPLVVEHKGQTQVIVNGTKRVRSYDLATGELLWQFGGMTVNAIPSVLAADGIAYCMSGYNGALAAAVPLESRGELTSDKSFLWRATKGTPYVPSPLLVGDRLVFTQGNSAVLTILDRKTGRALVDRARLPVDGQFYASPSAAAGRIYLVTRDGTSLVLAQKDALEVLATNQLDDRIDASPVLVGRQLFLRGEKTLYCIEEK